MNPQRKLFAWYLAIWFVAALTPAAFAVASFYGMDQLRSVVAKAVGVGNAENTSIHALPEPPLPSLEPAAHRRDASSFSVQPLALQRFRK